MNFEFDEQQRELRRTAESFLADNSSSDDVRRAMETERGYDEALWKRIGGELGWPAVIVPESYGGIGLGYVDLIALLEPMGAALLCSPFFSTVCLGANALLAAGTEEQKERYLPAIAAGELTATLALTESNGRWDAEAVTATLSREGDSLILGGTKSYVPDGHTADLLIVAVRTEGSHGTEGVSLVAVDADTPGLKRRHTPTMDQTRAQAEIVMDGLRIDATALMGAEGEGWSPIRRTLDLAAIALAAEQVGGAERVLDMTVEYAKERVQFGRPIGSFQAIKHKCADMMVEVESARSAAYYAAWAAGAEEPDLSELASLAKSYCSDAYFRAAADAIQIHGGVGFTWEYDAHLFFKRAKSTETFLGSPAYHRERVAKLIGL